MVLPEIDFRQIRDHQGSKDRAFEELCYQLIPTLIAIPDGVIVQRFGTPDGGVEAILKTPDGTVTAWQAKYFFEFGDSQFQQMKGSFLRALETQPNLDRIVFCFPADLPAAAKGRAKSALKKWESHKSRWQEIADSKGRSVEIVYVGHSQLLQALVVERNHGRAFYWFNSILFGDAWFQDRLQETIADAGDGYDPTLHVGLSIAGVFDALGRTRSYQRQLRRLLGQIRRARRYWNESELRPHVPDFDASLQVIQERLDVLDNSVMEVDIPGQGVIHLSDIDARCDDAAVELRRQSSVLRSLEDSIEQTAEEKRRGGSTVASILRNGSYYFSRTASAVEELQEFLRETRAKLLNSRALLLTGVPGTGKTHLFCDAASRRLEDKQPTVLLLGRKFVAGNVWQQLLVQLELDCTADVFLDALDAAAEAAGAHALIMIDAINEGAGIDVWPAQLAGFLHKVRRRSRLALAISCRSTYLKGIIPASLQGESLTKIEHQGFAGAEIRATKLFFERFGLRLPDFPLLVPEFRNPLFLKLMCRALKHAGYHEVPRGSSGISWLLNIFLANVDDVLSAAGRCDFAPNTGVIRQAVANLARFMNENGNEFLTFSEAQAVLSDALPGRGWDKSLLNGLLTEGILVQERDFNDQEVIRFTYQRVGDYFRADALMKSSSTEAAISEICTRLVTGKRTRYTSGGLLEALAVIVPERLGRELPDLVPSSAFGLVEDAYLGSLIWRDIAAFEKPLNLTHLNRVRRFGWGGDKVLRTLLATACIPDHPFNAELLHANLWRRSMPDRDQLWSVFVHWSSDEESPVMRLIDWAWSDDTSYCADDAALLCATALAWLLTSSNRYIRDRATKALVNLLRGRPEVVLQLLDRFHGVDDLYVAERVYAAAYGFCLTTRDESIRKVASKVYALVFAGGQPPAHLLLRDYARGVIEWALSLNCLPSEIELNRVRPPYSSPWPLKPPSEESLQKRYSREDGWGQIWSSVLSWGDFHRYIVQSAVEHFVAPNQNQRKAEREQHRKSQIEESWQGFLDSLTERQLDLLVADPTSKRLRLSKRQMKLLDNFAWKRSWRDDRPVLFNADEASRWILREVARLGWTPKRFREFDEGIGYRHGRNEHRSERIGKKYQWIAVYELLARIADHCVMHSWSGEEQYDGPWQLWKRNLDPSLLIRLDREEDDEEPPQSVPKWLIRYSPSFPSAPALLSKVEWVRSKDNLPNPQELIELTDPSGNDWMLLNGYFNWDEEVSPEEERFDANRCHMWVQIRGYLINRADYPKWARWAGKADWMGRWMPEGRDLHGVFLGEYPWHPSCRLDEPDDWSRPRKRERSELPIAVLPLVSTYSWEAGGYDRSLGASVSAELPARFLVDHMGLAWSGREFAWRQGADIVLDDPSVGIRGLSFLVAKPDAIKQFLGEEYSLVWTVLGEKIIYRGLGDRAPRLHFSSALGINDGSIQRVGSPVFDIDIAWPD